MTLVQYAQLALKKGAKCWDCKAQVGQEDLRHYDHSSGWRVEGFPELQWLYFACCGCHYETSFAKLGIRRPVP